jgi:hypothetical protein
VGSLRRSASNTLISILLASRYFWTARITLMATLRRFSTFLASTTLPNVPWPKRRTILSGQSAGKQKHKKQREGLTLATDDIVRTNDVVPFGIIPCICLRSGNGEYLWPLWLSRSGWLRGVSLADETDRKNLQLPCPSLVQPCRPRRLCASCLPSWY